jgi:hypothetical protein
MELPKILDEGRAQTGLSITFHGKAGQKKVGLSFNGDHLSDSAGVANASMLGIEHVAITKVQSSHPNMVSGISLFQGAKGPPVESNSCGVTTDTKSGAVYKHHAVLGSITPNHPATINFTAAGSDPTDRLEAFKLGAARDKYDPTHSPREGIHKVTVDGKPPVYTTPVNGGSPLSILIRSNPQLNKVDAKGAPVYHMVGDTKHHVVEQAGLDSALEVLEKHLKPSKIDHTIKFELHTPNPPDVPYTVTAHGYIQRGQFIGDDGSPAAPEPITSSRPLRLGSEIPNQEAPGYPGLMANCTMEKLSEVD